MDWGIPTLLQESLTRAWRLFYTCPKCGNLESVDTMPRHVQWHVEEVERLERKRQRDEWNALHPVAVCECCGRPLDDEY